MHQPIRVLVVTLLLAVVPQWLWAQATGVLTGTVRDQVTQEPLIGAAVGLEGTTLGASTDADGRFRLTNIPPGSYNVKASALGYTPLTRYNVVVTSGNEGVLNLEVTATAQQLGEVEVVANRAVRVATAETPLSIQRLNTEEIRSNPGGNFDISRVVQALPGVGGGGTGGSAGFRNDIIIRGGAPNENVYYLDGVEIPVINHFSTQGSAGGPTGILNVSFIEDVTVSTSAFDARYDNVLSGVLQFRQRDGNPDRFQGNLRTSATEVAGTVEGPLAKNTTFLASARRSYLQTLFSALDFPIRPAYWDFQYKVTTKLSAKTTLTALGVGALDDFKVVVPKESSPEKADILNSTPSYKQNSYTAGFALRHLIPNGYWNMALSRTALDSRVDLFENRQIGDESKRLLLTRANEAENKLRFDLNRTTGRWKLATGAVAQVVEFANRFQSVLRRELRDTTGQVVAPGLTVRYQSDLRFVRYGLFGQVSRTLGPNDRLTLAAGLRADGNSFTTGGHNLLRTLSPRVSASYALTDRWNLNASVGRYYKIPPSTLLGFRDEAGTLVNQSNRYIGATHYVAGLEFIPAPATRFTLEGFWKQYDHYPVSVRDGISLANLGADFTALGNEAVTSTGRGRAFGAEFFFQQKLTRNVFAVVAYTWFKSEFSGADGRYKPTVWDTRHLLSVLLGYKFGHGWELGGKYRLAGGAPYTPYDLTASRLNFLALGQGILDYSQLNTQRLGTFQQVDLRLDRKFNLRRLTLDFYLDLTNAFFLVQPAPAAYTFKRTDDGKEFITTDGQPIRPDGANAQPVLLDNSGALAIPTIGIIVEF